MQVNILNHLHIRIIFKVPLINLLEIIPINTEDERCFSAMNTISADLRNLIIIENISSILFIKLNGPSIGKLDHEKYVNWREQNEAERRPNTGRSNRIESKNYK